MKYILFLFLLTIYICGCENSYPKIDDRKVDKDFLFNWSVDKFIEYSSKATEHIRNGNRDSSLYYLGKENAFKEVSIHISELKK